MRDAHPRQDQEAALVGDLVHVRPAHFRRPADEAVTRSEVPRRRGEAQAGERSPGAQGQVLDLLTDAPHRAEVMRLGDQVIEESFQRRAANRHQFDRAQGVETPFQRRAVHLTGGGRRRAMALFGGRWRTAGSRCARPGAGRAAGCGRPCRAARHWADASPSVRTGVARTPGGWRRDAP
jgi:hypothetical protein